MVLDNRNNTTSNMCPAHCLSRTWPFRKGNYLGRLSLTFSGADALSHSFINWSERMNQWIVDIRRHQKGELTHL